MYKNVLPMLRFVTANDDVVGSESQTNDEAESLSEVMSGESDEKSTPDDDEESSDDDDSEPEPAPDEGSWKKVFAGKTPKQVSDEIAKWRDHAKKWEKRAKDNRTNAEQLQETQAVADSTAARLAAAEKSLTLYQTLAEVGADIPLVMDSVTFVKNAQELDPEDDDYAEQVTDLVKAFNSKKRASVKVPGRETPAGGAGVDLYALVNGKE